MLDADEREGSSRGRLDLLLEQLGANVVSETLEVEIEALGRFQSGAEPLEGGVLEGGVLEPSGAGPPGAASGWMVVKASGCAGQGILILAWLETRDHFNPFALRASEDFPVDVDRPT